jgi:hypothetical protein
MRFWPLLVLCFMAPASSIDFPPIANRFDSVPPEARAALKALQRVDSLVEAGISVGDYNRAVGEAHAEVKAFLSSPGAAALPELRFTLENAAECYRVVGDLLRKKNSSSPSDAYEASIFLLTAQPMLWKVAATNISGARAFLDSPKEELTNAQKTLSEGAENLTVEAGEAAAREQLRRFEREERAKKSNTAVPEDVPESELVDIVSLVFEDGIFGPTVTAGDFTPRLPPIYEKVPPASHEGLIPLYANGEQKGGMGVFIYEDQKAAQKAYEAAEQILGKSRKKLQRVGNAASIGNFGGTFRRANVVVYIHLGVLPEKEFVAAAKKIDAKIKAAPKQPVEETFK